jgi:hypothetical protein
MNRLMDSGQALRDHVSRKSDLHNFSAYQAGRSDSRRGIKRLSNLHDAGRTIT